MHQKNNIKTSKGLILMLGGFLYDFNENQQKKLKITKDLKRWKNDFNQFQKAFINENIRLYHCELPKLISTFEENMYLIKKFFTQPASSYILLWSGHGIPYSGDWALTEKRSITLQDVLQAWYNGLGYSNNKLLLIIVNSCHSGAWITELKSYISQNNEKVRKLRLAIQVGCKAEEESFVQTQDLVDEFEIGSLLIRKMVHDKKKFEESRKYLYSNT
jgi:hypothetical protein